MHNRQIKNDPWHGTIEYGKKYGEQSYNNEPIKKEPEDFSTYTNVLSTSLWRSFYDTMEENHAKTYDEMYAKRGYSDNDCLNGENDKKFIEDDVEVIKWTQRALYLQMYK